MSLKEFKHVFTLYHLYMYKYIHSRICVNWITFYMMMNIYLISSWVWYIAEYKKIIFLIYKKYFVYYNIISNGMYNSILMDKKERKIVLKSNEKKYESTRVNLQSLGP
jgi:hypothetical protein